jgi:hypothetical protein
MDKDQQDELVIPTELAIDQRVIPFEGDDLAAALTGNGSIYLSIPGITRALGLDHRSQLKRMQRTPVLSRGMRQVELHTPKGMRLTNCLRLDKVALWLGGIETSRMDNRTAAAKIERYQEDLAPAATAVFLQTFGAPDEIKSVQDTALVVMPETAQGVELFLEEHIRMLLDEHLLPQLHRRFDHQEVKLDQIITLLVDLVGGQTALLARQSATEAEVARLDERTQGLSPQHKRLIKDRIDRLVSSSKHEAVPLTYVVIYGKLKHQFRVAKYDEIADGRFDEVMAFLDSFIIEGRVAQSQLF